MAGGGAVLLSLESPQQPDKLLGVRRWTGLRTRQDASGKPGVAHRSEEGCFLLLQKVSRLTSR